MRLKVILYLVAMVMNNFIFDVKCDTESNVPNSLSSHWFMSHCII